MFSLGFRGREARPPALASNGSHPDRHGPSGFLDRIVVGALGKGAYAREHGLDSRSGVVHEALVLLRERALSADYLAAWNEWADDADTAVWDSATADGLDGSTAAR